MSRKDHTSRSHAIRQRMAATGERYTTAARHLAQSSQPTMIHAERLHEDLMEALRKLGWPVQEEQGFEFARYLGYAGPASVETRRDHHLSPLGGDEDPDDPELFDLSLPPLISIHAPHDLEGVGGLWQETDGNQPIAALAATVSDTVARGRAAAVASVRADSGCAICGDPYPQSHLLHTVAAAELAVCPACAFDGDLLAEPATAFFTYEYDNLMFEDLSAPAGWTAVAALLAYAAEPGLRELLQTKWHEFDAISFPYDHWDEPGQLWIWLPPASARPKALASFGPGACLQAVADAIDAAHPDLHDQVRALQRESWMDAEGTDDGEGCPDWFVAQIWPAVIAYAVTLTTQRAERPDTSGLSNLLGSFDELRSHLPEIGSRLDPDDIESTISCGLQALAGPLALTEIPV